VSAAEQLQHPKHLKQIEALEDPTRFKFWLAGRRGGKTIGILEDLLEGAALCPDGGEIFYIGPANQDAMELIWEKLIDRLDELRWKYRPLISKQRVTLSRKRKVYVIGAENIRRIRGHKVWRAYLDEVAFFKVPLKTVWKAVRPALSDLKGRAVCATTPNGKGTDAYDFYREIISKTDWKYFHWFTEDNPYIDRDEIEDAKRELDDKAFNEEYRAGWESYEGLAYYNFDEMTHVKVDLSGYDLNRPLILNFDFNVNPTTLLIMQKHGPILRWLREFSQKRGSTEDTVREFCEDLDEYLRARFPEDERFLDAKQSVLLKIRGDASGNSEKSNTGRSDYYYVKEVLRHYGFTFEMEVPASNPPIVDRVKHVNAYLKNVSGESRIEISQQCKELIRDLGGQELNGRIPSDKNNLGHKADAFGYCVWWDYLTTHRKPQGTVQL
jgi:hypothetical protein